MYKETRNNLDTFLKIDSLWDETTSVSKLKEALNNDNWQIQQAALSAIGDRGELKLLTDIDNILEIQDSLDIYGCPDEWDFDAASSVAEKELWRCRFRVKQAALIAVSKLIDKHGGDIVDDVLLNKILKYAVDQGEDFSIRVASCEVLGKIKTPATRKILEKASQDAETCTRLTAEEGLKRAKVTD